jgi:hypothetical protein
MAVDLRGSRATWQQEQWERRLTAHLMAAGEGQEGARDKGTLPPQVIYILHEALPSHNANKL